MYLPNPGGFASYSFGITTNPSDGQTIIMTTPDGTVLTFTFKNTPSDCKHIQIGATVNDSTVNLVEVLSQDYYLANNYSIAYNPTFPTNLLLAAQEKGTAYTITFSGTAPTLIFLTDGVDVIKRSELRIYVDIFGQEEISLRDFDKIIGQEYKPDELQQIIAEVQEGIRASLSPDIPVFNQTALSFNKNSLRLFQIKLTEAYNDPSAPAIPHCYMTAQVIKAILGGVAYEKFPGSIFPNAYLPDADSKFLTNAPRSILVHREQQLFLSAFTPSNFDVNVKIYLSDGTSGDDTFYSIAGSTKSQVFIPVGYQQLDLETFFGVSPDNPIVRYEVFIFLGSDETERFIFELDDSNPINKRFFLFHNSLNGWDSLYCSGDQQEFIETETSQYERNIPDEYFSTVGVTKVVPALASDYDALTTRSFEINTGFRPLEYIRFLARELALSEKVLLQTETQLLEVTIDKTSIKEVVSDAQDLCALKFKYSLAWADNTY